MTEIPLRLGPLQADGYRVTRSGARWLCESGQYCRADQPIAFFNISVEFESPRPGVSAPFSGETLQVVCAPRVAGRVTFEASTAPGGYLSILRLNRWEPDTILARLAPEDGTLEGESDPGLLRLLLLAGRRMTPLVDVHSGLLPGWNCRSRGWWCDSGEIPVTLLSLGICDVTGVILGEECAFLEMFGHERAPTHFVFAPDHPIAPAVPVLLDQLERTDAQSRAIAADLHTSLSKAAAVPTADDWMFAGTLLSTIQRNPMRESHDLISAAGLLRCPPPNAILLSVTAEPPMIRRHKTLGYRLHFLHHHLTAAGPAVRHWLNHAFESVPRTIGDIKADYEALARAVEKSTGARLIVLNRMSTSGDEDISTYAPFDAPLSGTLANIAAKELNLMLHDIAASHHIAILDVDAIAAYVGGGEHLPDSVHQSHALQEILRSELLTILDECRPAAT